VAQYAVEKAMALGAKVITVSDSAAPSIDEAGFTPEKLAELMEVKNHLYGRVSDYAERVGATFRGGVRRGRCRSTWPCRARPRTNSTRDDAATLVANGVKCVAEGANMPTTIEAVKLFEASRRAVRAGQGQQRRRRGDLGPGNEPERDAPERGRATRSTRACTASCAASTKPACSHGKRADGSRQLRRRRQRGRLREGGRRDAGAGRRLIGAGFFCTKMVETPILTYAGARPRM
jgi:glutamate dehydrogenase (NADP+)